MQVTLGLTDPIFHGRVQNELAVTLTAAAGAGFVYEVGTDYVERMDALAFELVTAATVANRQVILSLLDPNGAVLAAIPAGSVQAASLTHTYSFLRGVSQVNPVAGLVQLSPLFPFPIPPLYSLSVSIVAVAGADQIKNIRLYRSRFSTGPDGYPQGGYPESALLDRAEARAARLT